MTIFDQMLGRYDIKTAQEKLGTADINMVKRDIMPFIQNPSELDIWSNEYFLQLADRIKYRHP